MAVKRSSAGSSSARASAPASSGTSSSSSSSSSFAWTAEREALLFGAILLHGLKPAGRAKNFKMALILDHMAKGALISIRIPLN